MKQNEVNEAIQNEINKDKGEKHKEYYIQQQERKDKKDKLAIIK